MKNMTIVTEFILLGFPLLPHLILPIFCLVLISYILTVMGNILILNLVLLNKSLQSPMYFFLCNLAIIDICFINTTVPNLLKDIIRKEKSISLVSCLTQSYIFFLVGTAEFILLAVMSVDRYLAICYPLQYTAIMKQRVCIQLIAGVWLGSIFSMCIPTYLVLRLSFCCSEIDHFMCDVGPLLRNSCTSTEHIEKWVLASSSVVIISFLITLLSYFNILIVIVKIKSAGGRERVFTTCSSHAIVVTLIYGSCIFMYSQPIESHGPSLNKEVSVINTIVVPLINPCIYTLRNQNVREKALKMIFVFFLTKATMGVAGEVGKVYEGEEH